MNIISGLSLDDITQVVYVIGGAIIKCLTKFDLDKK